MNDIGLIYIIVMKSSSHHANYIQSDYKVMITEPSCPVMLEKTLGNDSETGIECCELSVSSIAKDHSQENNDSEIDELKINFLDIDTSGRLSRRHKNSKGCSESELASRSLIIELEAGEILHSMKTNIKKLSQRLDANDTVLHKECVNNSKLIDDVMNLQLKVTEKRFKDLPQNSIQCSCLIF